MALITILKTVFAQPWLPEEVRLVAAGGFSFPSGHAIIATIGYGVLAFDLEEGIKRTRYAVAGTLIVLIGLSRVVLGGHFLRAVVAGVVVGLVFLVLAEVLTGHAPRPGFLLAAGLGVAAVLVSGFTHDSLAEFGAIQGAAGAWEVFELIPPVESLRKHLVLLGGGLPVLAAISYLSLFASTLPSRRFSSTRRCLRVSSSLRPLSTGFFETPVRLDRRRKNEGRAFRGCDNLRTLVE